jgi:hypothetical protein
MLVKFRHVQIFFLQYQYNIRSWNYLLIHVSEQSLILLHLFCGENVIIRSVQPGVNWW